ncbi:hypothetical protein [Candidatus Nitrotoga sp. BS]|uniref:hypothetical protein n=1 Tax=Candidatus Nitrotoga sp. BS TaxID=2890408 RepID=UPI001EF2647C|nr:hypothetical protein [Candidatus Nitrotoga sp. BS]
MRTIASLTTHIIIPFRLWLVNQDGKYVGAGSLKDFEERLENSQWDSKNNAVKHNPNDEDNPSDEDLYRDSHDYQAYNYFHPFVRRFWYDKNKVARFQRTDIKKLHVRLSGFGMPSDPIEFEVKQCELIRFDPHIGLLHISLKSTGKLPLSIVQASLDQIRRIYPPYFDSDRNNKKEEIWKGGHYPLEVRLIGKKGELVTSSFPDNEQDSKAERNKLLETAQSFRKKRNEVNSYEPQSYLWAEHWRYLTVE